MNKPALAKRFRVSIKSIDNWVVAGCPCRRGPRGQYIFDLKAVQAWRREMLPPRTKSSGGAVVSYAASRARKEAALAGLRELQLQQRRGELVELIVVQNDFFRFARNARDRMQNLPARLSGILAASSDQEEIFQLLTREIDQALEEVANGYQAPAKQDQDKQA